MLEVKKDFPIFEMYPDLIYLDNAATSQKPTTVIEAISNYYKTANANVHRGVHTLSDQSTTAFETAKKNIATFFGANHDELILTRNATEALNGLAYGWADHHIKQDDVILVSVMEHHANIVPWQEVCKRTGAKLEFIKLDNSGELDLTDLSAKISQHGQKIKLVTVVQVSNALGTVTDIAQIKSILDKNNSPAKLAVDGAQSAPHLKINFANLGADFYAFSGHKMLGPMGIGGLIVKNELLKNAQMTPWLFGGGMIDSVQKEQTEFNQDLSERFIAGTPDVASTVGLEAACSYLQKLGMEQVEKHDRELTAYALEKLSQLNNVNIVGPKNMQKRLGSVAFTYKGVHAHDVAQILDSQNIAVRSGHHCTMPLHTENNWLATIRASFSVYNTKSDVDALVAGLKKVGQVFA